MAGYTPTTFQIRTYRSFEPTEISGLKLWLDASDLTGADGSSVSAWLDKSGNEAHFYQQTTSFKPTLQTNELNSLNIVRFDGSNDFLSLTAPLDNIPTSVSAINTCEFSNDGNYLIVSNGSTSPYLIIYKKNGNVFNKLSDPLTLPTGTINGFSWSADDVYIAIPHATSPRLTIYKRSGDVFTALSSPASLPDGTVYDCSFSSNGTYLIVVGASTGRIKFYKRSGDVFSVLSNPATAPAGTIAYSVEFSPDTNYVAIGSSTSPFIQIYSRSGDTLTKISDPTNLPTINVQSISWYDSLTFACMNGTTCNIYQYNGTKFELLTSFTALGTITALSYSKDKNYLSVAHANTPFVSVYNVTSSGTVYTKISNPLSLPISTGRGVSFSNNDNFLAVSHTTSPFLQIYSFSSGVLTNLSKLNMIRNVGSATLIAVVKYPNNSLQNDSILISGGTGADRANLFQRNNNLLAMSSRRNDANSNAILTSTTTANNNFFIQLGIFDYTNSDGYLYINGYKNVESLSYGTSGNTSDTDSIFIRIGGTTSEYLQGDIAEVMVFNKVLSDLEIKNVNEYLSRKYNLTLA